MKFFFKSNHLFNRGMRNKNQSFIPSAPIFFLNKLPIDHTARIGLVIDVGEITINWGDGVIDTITSSTTKPWPTAPTFHSHYYSTAGNYLIEIDGDVDKIRCFYVAEGGECFILNWNDMMGLSDCYYIGSTAQPFYTPNIFKLDMLQYFPLLKAIQFSYYNVIGDLSNFNIYETIPYLSVTNGGNIVGDIKHVLEKPIESNVSSTRLNIDNQPGLYCTTFNLHPSLNNVRFNISDSLNTASIDALIKSMDSSIVAPSTGRFNLGEMYPRTHNVDVEYESLLAKGYLITPTINGQFPVIDSDVIIEDYNVVLTDEMYNLPLSDDAYNKLLEDL